MPAGIEVEDSVTSSLVQLLKNKELNAYFKKTYSTVSGRKEPDITIETLDGIFLLEAKMPPNVLPQAMSKVGDYKEAIGQTETIKGIFAIVYASGIKKDYEAWFAFDSRFELERFKKLDELAEWIADKVKEAPKPLAPVNTQKIIDILNESVALINQSVQSVDTSEIEEIFGGRDFFSTVLDYEEESHISDIALKNAASYLLLNQILFYQILSNEVSAYEKIEAKQLKEPSDLHARYFSRVLKDDYQPIFGFNVSALIKDHEAMNALKTAISAIQLLSPQMLNHDLLGKIFHNLIPLSLRKVVAAYYTNTEAAELLASIAVEKKNDKVIDPACGSGTLLVAAYNRKKSLYEKFAQDQHTRFLESEIFGADIMPFAAHLAAVNLALQAPLNFTNVVNVAIRDSTELAPGIKITSAQETIKESYKNHKITDFAKGYPPSKPKIKKGVIDLRGQERSIQLPKFDVVIMNPPFTRFQRIPPHFKAKLQSRFSSSRYKDIIHGQLGLHGYFLLLADKLLAPGGRVAAVLPVTTLSLEGFYGIINLFLNEYSIEHIIASSGRAAFSENTSLREILLIARKENPVPEHRIKFTFIHASPEELSIGKAHGISEKIRKFDDEEETNDDFYIRQINQWNFFDDIRSLYQAITLHSPQLVRIDDKIATLLKRKKLFRQLKTLFEDGWDVSEYPVGWEKVYYPLSIVPHIEGQELKNHDVWIIKNEKEMFIEVEHRFNKSRFKVPRNCLINQIRRFSGRQTVSIKPPYEYLVIRKFDGFDDFIKATGLVDAELNKKINRVIREGEWEKFVTEKSANVFAFRRGDLSATGTYILSFRSRQKSFPGAGGSWVFSVPKNYEVIPELWLNSSFAFYFILRDRKETRGSFVQFDKYVFSNMLFPDPKKMNLRDAWILEKEISKFKFPSLLEQFQTGFEGRKKIDKFFLDYVGMEREEQERFLKLLYETIAKELIRLKGVMRK